MDVHLLNFVIIDEDGLVDQLVEDNVVLFEALPDKVKCSLDAKYLQNGRLLKHFQVINLLEPAWFLLISEDFDQLFVEIGPVGGNAFQFVPRFQLRDQVGLWNGFSSVIFVSEHILLLDGVLLQEVIDLCICLEQQLRFVIHCLWLLKTFEFLHGRVAAL